MSDWRDLPAGRELDSVVAEAFGWWCSVDSGKEEWYGPDYDANINPNPKPLAAFSLDASAALSLLDPHWTVMIVTIDPGEWYRSWYCSINSISRRVKDHGDGTAETVALAVCRALLDWHDKQS